MHCLSSSICTWVWTIIRETTDTLYLKTSKETEEENSIDEDLTLYVFKNVSETNLSTRLLTSKCQGDEGLKYIYTNYSPYLYPFSVEFSILVGNECKNILKYAVYNHIKFNVVVGVLYVIWEYIGTCKNTDKPCKYIEEIIEENTEINKQSNLVLNVDFHASNKGLFCGIIFTALCVVSIILFFIALSNE